MYLDPPFNSNRTYNVIFDKHPMATGDAAQIQAFDDTWHWTPVTDQQYQRVRLAGGCRGGLRTRCAFRTLLGESDAMAYLVNMAPRLVELHRVLKPTGSLYLHCDPTMSHYLKMLLDAIFGAEQFATRSSGSAAARTTRRGATAAVHDDMLFYTQPPLHLEPRLQPLPVETLDSGTATSSRARDGGSSGTT